MFIKSWSQDRTGVFIVLIIITDVVRFCKQARFLGGWRNPCQRMDQSGRGPIYHQTGKHNTKNRSVRAAVLYNNLTVTIYTCC